MTAPDGLYVTQAMVEAYLSAAVVRDTLDDDNSGAPDDVPVAQAIRDGEAITSGTMRGIYTMPLTAPIDPLVQTLTLKAIHCQLIQRHPERFRANASVCSEVAQMRKEIRSGDLQLGHPLITGARDPQVDSFCNRNIHWDEGDGRLDE